MPRNTENLLGGTHTSMHAYIHTYTHTFIYVIYKNIFTYKSS